VVLFGPLGAHCAMPTGNLHRQRPNGVLLLRCMSPDVVRSCGWRMSASPPLLEGKQTFGEVRENDAQHWPIGFALR
jgi:hypothetical protein